MLVTKWLNIREVDMLMTFLQSVWLLWNNSGCSYSNVDMCKALLSQISHQLNVINVGKKQHVGTLWRHGKVNFIAGLHGALESIKRLTPDPIVTAITLCVLFWQPSWQPSWWQPLSHDPTWRPSRRLPQISSIVTATMTASHDVPLWRVVCRA